MIHSKKKWIRIGLTLVVAGAIAASWNALVELFWIGMLIAASDSWEGGKVRAARQLGVHGSASALPTLFGAIAETAGPNLPGPDELPESLPGRLLGLAGGLPFTNLSVGNIPHFYASAHEIVMRNGLRTATELRAGLTSKNARVRAISLLLVAKVRAADDETISLVLSIARMDQVETLRQASKEVLHDLKESGPGRN
jgi:hypothetical protein